MKQEVAKSESSDEQEKDDQSSNQVEENIGDGLFGSFWRPKPCKDVMLLNPEQEESKEPSVVLESYSEVVKSSETLNSIEKKIQAGRA